MKNIWKEVKIITTCEAIEPVSGIFYGLDVKGVAIEDPNDILNKEQNSLSWDFADINIFEYGDRAAVVKGYFSPEENIDSIIDYIRNKLDELKDFGISIGEGNILVSEVNEEDWATSWKKYYKPVKLGKEIIIKPTWEDYSPSEGEIIIELDPGMAFGTGTHETTAMCVELLEKHVKRDDIIFDIGTGSGILAITSSKLGAREVIGVDLDEVAVDAARENVRTNGLTNIEIRHGNLTDVISGKADIIVANIIADAIISLAGIIKPLLKDEGFFISSGIIKDRKNDVLAALEMEGHRILEIKEKGEWVAVVTTIK